MDMSTIKAHIKTKEFDPFYIFTGPEVKVRDIYIEHMATSFDATVVYEDSVADILKKLHSRSFVQKRQIHVLFNDKDFLSSEKIQARIERPDASQTDIVIFVYSAIDKRTKFAKKYADRVVVFDYLKPAVLTKYIKKDIPLSDAHCTQLIEICESDYSRILLEIDKLFGYHDATGSTPDQAFEALLRDGTIHVPPYDAIFDFVDAVLTNRPRLAFNLLEQSYKYGESTLALISVLYTSTKQLLQVQSCKSQNVAQSTGLNGFQIKLAKGRVGVYNIGDLVYLMKLIRKVEKGIKTGEIEDSMAVPYILVNFW